MNPYEKLAKCKVCKQKVHQKHSHYCNQCAYKLGVFAWQLGKRGWGPSAYDSTCLSGVSVPCLGLMASARIAMDFARHLRHVWATSCRCQGHEAVIMIKFSPGSLATPGGSPLLISVLVHAGILLSGIPDPSRHDWCTLGMLVGSGHRP